MARKSPAFSFYADSWLGGTAIMSRAEKGLYVDMLACNWLHGCLTREQMARACHVTPNSNDEKIFADLLASKFVATGDGRYFNERLEEERKKQQSRKAAGSRGGRKKAENAKQTRSKTSSKTPSKKLGSVSDSVSVSITDTNTDSGESARAVPDSEIVDAKSGASRLTRVEPGWLVEHPDALSAWRAYLSHCLDSVGSFPTKVRQEQLLQKCQAMLREHGEKYLSRTITESIAHYDRPQLNFEILTWDRFRQQSAQNGASAIEKILAQSRELE